MKKFKLFFLSFLISYLIIIPGLALAQTSPSGTEPQRPQLLQRLENVANKGGYTTDAAIASTPRIIGIIVGAFISFTGLTFIILMVIAGYSWMTSGGNEEKVKKAVSTIKVAIIGLIVSLSAWTLWNFVFKLLIMG